MNQLLYKREQLSVQIRKQKREEIFALKRHVDHNISIEISKESDNAQSSIEALLGIFHQQWIEHKFNELYLTLNEINQFLVHLTLKYEIGSLDELITHYFLQNSKFIEILLYFIGFTDIHQNYNVDSIRLNCCQQAISFLINLTYFNIPAIFTTLIQTNIPRIILDITLSRARQQDKLYLNFDKWCEIIADICQLFINILLEDSIMEQELLIIKNDIINSNLIKIWKLIIQKNIGATGWFHLIPLLRITLTEPKPKEEDIKMNHILQVFQFCCSYIKEFETELICEAFIILQLLSFQYPAQAAIVTRSIWDIMVQNKKYYCQIYAIFSNIISIKDETFEIESTLIDIGILDNLRDTLTIHSLDKIIIKKIYLLINNLLYYQHHDLKSLIIYEFIPYLREYLNNNSVDKDLSYEFIFMITNLNLKQLLTINDYEKLWNDSNMIMIRDIMLSQFELFPFLLNMFLAYETCSAQIKYRILLLENKYQIYNCMNQVADKWEGTQNHQQLIETYFYSHQEWQQQVNQLADLNQF